jgi:hypothetical protein
VGAGLLALAGVRAGGGGVVLYADDVVGSVAPSTGPPMVTAGPPGAVELPDTSSTAPGHVGPRAEPVGLKIDTIKVARYPVRDVGLQDDGQLEIPDETEIGWYKYGATAGHPGATVLAAHVRWAGSPGPFSQLGAVDPGDQVEVALNDGTTRDYVVTERKMHGKLALPKKRIWRTTGPEELVLITCGGEFNPELDSFKSNIVVYAVPVG